jgi:acetyl esterase
MNIHPNIQNLIEQTAAAKNPPVQFTPIVTLRNNAKKLALLSGDPDDVHHVENEMLLVDGREVRIRLYYPNDKKDLPTILYFHPGGYVRGDIDIFDGVCRALCNSSEMIIATLDYNLAPEFQYPSQLDEAHAALLWLRDRGATRVSVGGESSGGNLAAALALRNRDSKGPRLESQLLIYPQLDYTNSLPSHKEFASGFILEEDALKFYGDQYVPKEFSREEPLISPLFAADLKGLPPAIIITAEYDILRDDGREYASRLQEMGVHVDFREFSGMTHGFFQMIAVVGREGIEYAGTILKNRSC